MKIRQNITAIIYDKRGSVLSVGQNSYIKTHPLQAKHAALVGLHDKIYLHAEMAAIVRCKDLSKAHRIVVMRLGKSGRELLAKPCAICQSAIKASGIEIVEYTV